MKKARVLVALFLGLLSAGLHAQQNFFNVPSADVCEKGTWFFQQQVNLLRSGNTSNTTFNIGLGHKTEIGINVNALEFESQGWAPYQAQAPAPFFLLNGQKAFLLPSELSLSIGAQAGMAPRKTWGNYVYSNLKWEQSQQHLKLLGGIYSANKAYMGPGNRGFGNAAIGFQLGMEKALVPELIYFQMDLIGGRHRSAEAVFGTAIKCSKHLVVSLGYQVPTSSNNAPGWVFELTRI